MTDDEIIAVLQARKEGKIIQTRSHFHPLEGWQDCTPVWDFYQNDYRVKPELGKPREWWITPIRFSLCHVSEVRNDDALWHAREVIE